MCRRRASLCKTAWTCPNLLTENPCHIDCAYQTCTLRCNHRKKNKRAGVREPVCLRRKSAGPGPRVHTRGNATVTGGDFYLFPEESIYPAPRKGVQSSLPEPAGPRGEQFAKRFPSNQSDLLSHPLVANHMAFPPGPRLECVGRPRVLEGTGLPRKVSPLQDTRLASTLSFFFLSVLAYGGELNISGNASKGCFMAALDLCDVGDASACLAASQ